jgi:uncharacterized protein YjbJ (UPF0337 family)
MLRFQTAANVPHVSYAVKAEEAGENVNRNQFEGKWKRLTGSARERWGKLTNNNWETVAGKKDQLAGRIQEQYGVVKANADQRADNRALARKGSEREKHGAARL